MPTIRPQSFYFTAKYTFGTQPEDLFILPVVGSKLVDLSEQIFFSVRVFFIKLTAQGSGQNRI
jgi:hypothetical protein